MATNRRKAAVVLGVAVVALMPPLAPPTPAASGQASPAQLEARIWLDRGEDAVVGRGESVRVYYRASADAYVAVFHLDTNGTVRLVFPSAPDEGHSVHGGRDYRLLFTRSPYWEVDEDAGVGYFFLVATPVPFDLAAFSFSYFDHGWDLASVGRQVYRDPFLAMDDYVAALVPGWASVPYTLAFLSYHVGGTHEYPRFLCYDCHAFRPLSSWNPYEAVCSDFQVVVASDPFHYPATRPGAARVAFERSGSSAGRFEVVPRAGTQPGPVLDGAASSVVLPSTVAPDQPRPVLQPRPPGPPAPPPPPPPL